MELPPRFLWRCTGDGDKFFASFERVIWHMLMHTSENKQSLHMIDVQKLLDCRDEAVPAPIALIQKDNLLFEIIGSTCLFSNFVSA